MDDCTYSVAAEDPAALSEKLTAQYEEISKYMAANGLVRNDDKLHVIVFTRKKIEEFRDTF